MKTIKVRIVAGLTSLAMLVGFAWITTTVAPSASASPAASHSIARILPAPADSPWY